MYRLSIIASVLLVIVLSKPLNPNRVLWAADTGLDQEFRSATGFKYKADTGFSKNTRTSNYNNNDEIREVKVKYTQDSDVYKTERHADESFTYSIPVETPGKYVLITKYAEMWFREAGKRAFNLRLGNCLVAEKIDVVAKVGKFAAYDEYTEFELKLDQIYHQGKLCPGALKGSKLVVTFEHIGIDNPMINAIVLYSGGLEDTDYAELGQQRADWDRREADEKRKKEEEKERRAEASQKKFEKHRRRNDEIDDINEDTEDFDHSSVHHSNITEFLFSSSLLLFVGMVIILVVILRIVGQRLESGVEKGVEYVGEETTTGREEKPKKSGSSKKRD